MSFPPFIYSVDLPPRLPSNYEVHQYEQFMGDLYTEFPLGCVDDNTFSHLAYKYPEYQIIDDGECKVKYSGRLVRIKRIAFLGDSRCCINPPGLFYEENGQIFTCPPESLIPGKTSYCDEFLLLHCPSHSSIYCEGWITGLLQRANTSAQAIVAINLVMSSRCRTNINAPLCRSWITGLRETGLGEFEELSDSVVRDYCLNVDKSLCQCQFPPSQIQKLAAKTSIPQECWNSACVFGDRLYFSSLNFKQQKRCRVTSCLVSIDSLNLGPNATVTISNGCDQIFTGKFTDQTFKLADSFHVNPPPISIKFESMPFFALILFFLLGLLLLDGLKHMRRTKNFSIPLHNTNNSI